MSTDNKYARRVVGLEWDAAGRRMDAVIDVYSILTAYEVTDPALQHAVKKLLLAGVRGVKDRLTDLREARQSLDRAIEDAAPDGPGGEDR